MKVAVYARVSTRDKQECENQLVQLREFTQKQDWAIFREYVDRESGGTSEREQFQAMFADASRRKFDLVLFWALDRLSREGALETLQHLQRLSSYGVGYRSFAEPYLDSVGIFKDVIVAIMATLAKQERVRLSDRTKAGLARVRASGKKLGRPRIVVPVAEIHQLRAHGLSNRAIGRQLNLSRSTVDRLP